MAIIKIRYMVAKPQKGHILYYWQPLKRYYPHFMTLPLGRDIAKAITQAEKYNAELDEWRKSGIEPSSTKEGTVKWLTERYRKSYWYAGLAPRTQKDYDYAFSKINDFAGLETIASMTRVVCKGYYNLLCKKSVHSANAVVRVLKLLFTFAIDEGVADVNPVKGIRLISTKARQQVWSRNEIDTYVKKAIEQGYRSMALAVIIAENFGQRQADILALTWDKYNGKSMRVRQGKTKAHIEVKCTATLKRWLDSTEKTSNHIVVSETTKQPYKGDYFRHLFLNIKTGLKIDDKLFMDLRRTAVVRLGEAGCTIPEIAAITGHKIETCQKILEVYLPRNAQMASNAIDKLEVHRRKSRNKILEVVK